MPENIQVFAVIQLALSTGVCANCFPCSSQESPGHDRFCQYPNSETERAWYNAQSQFPLTASRRLVALDMSVSVRDVKSDLEEGEVNEGRKDPVAVWAVISKVKSIWEFRSNSNPCPPKVIGPKPYFRNVPSCFFSQTTQRTTDQPHPLRLCRPTKGRERSKRILQMCKAWKMCARARLYGFQSLQWKVYLA
jgi:hypothetical protein